MHIPVCLLCWCCVAVIAALDGVYGGVRGVHPGSSTARAERQLGDDAGLQTFYSGKKTGWDCLCVGEVLLLDVFTLTDIPLPSNVTQSVSLSDPLKRAVLGVRGHIG